MATQSRPTLTAETRQPTVRKSDLNRLRRSGQVPGNIFGHGEPENIQLSERELNHFLRRNAPGGLLDLQIEGKTVPTLLRELDRDGITGQVMAVGFQRVNLRETLRATVPVTIVGEEDLIKEGLVLQRQIEELEVTGRADILPAAITLDVTECEAGTTIRIGDLTLPEGIEPTKDLDLPVATISEPTVPTEVAAVLDAEEAEEAEEAEGAAAGA